MSLMLANGTSAVGITLGVAVIASLAGVTGIYATLGEEDRGGMRKILRHPLQTMFGEPDEPDPDDYNP